MRRDPRSIVLEPIITEKTASRRDSANEVAFKVARDANKIEIRGAVEELFDVVVTDVRTMAVTGKLKRLGRFEGRRASWKKAIVKLKEGQTIDLYDQM